MSPALGAFFIVRSATPGETGTLELPALLAFGASRDDVSATLSKPGVVRRECGVYAIRVVLGAREFSAFKVRESTHEKNKPTVVVGL